LRKQAGRNVGSAARREADDDAHRPAWVALRPSEARDGRQSGSTGCEMQKLSAGESYMGPLLKSGGGGRTFRFCLSARCPFPHFSISSATSVLKSPGEPPRIMPPRSAS